MLQVVGTLPDRVINPTDPVSTPINGAIQYNVSVADVQSRDAAYLLGRADVGKRLVAVVQVASGFIATPPTQTLVEAAPPKVRFPRVCVVACLLVPH